MTEQDEGEGDQDTEDWVDTEDWDAEEGEVE